MRILTGLVIVGLAVVIGAATLWPRGGDAGPDTASEVPAGGAIVDWAAGDEGLGSATPNPVNTDDEAEGGSTSPEAVIAADRSDGGLEEVHPADRAQATLLAAASQAAGPGVSRPAAEISGGDEARPPVDPDDVLSATAARGGCVLDYGDPGQCLPTRPPSSSTEASTASAWTCEDVRQLFPDGLTARAGDPLRLDGNGNGVACGTGD